MAHETCERKWKKRVYLHQSNRFRSFCFNLIYRVKTERESVSLGTLRAQSGAIEHNPSQQRCGAWGGVRVSDTFAPNSPRFRPLRAGPTGTDRARFPAASRQQTAEAPVCTEMLIHGVQWVLLEPRHTHTEAFIAYTRARLAEFPGQLDAGKASLSVCCSSAKVCAHALPSRNAVQYQ